MTPPNPQEQINTMALMAVHFGRRDEFLRLMPQATNLVNPRDMRRKTPLIVAASAGFEDWLDFLLPLSRWDDAAEDGDALLHAVRRAHFGCAFKLIAMAPDGYFSRQENSEKTHALLSAAIHSSNLADGFFKRLFGLIDFEESSAAMFGFEDALRRAARLQKLDIVRLLLPVCDPDNQDAEGCTALIASCQAVDANDDDMDGRCTRALLSVCDPTLADKNGDTALAVAIKNQAWRCADILALDRLRRESQAPSGAGRAFGFSRLLEVHRAELPMAHAWLEADGLARAVQESSRAQEKRNSAEQASAAPSVPDGANTKTNAPAPQHASKRL